MTRQKKATIAKVLSVGIISIIILILLIITFSISWICKYFANIGFDEIMFTLNMPLQGTSSDYINSYVGSVIIPSFGIIFELFAAIFLIRIFSSRDSKGKNKRQGFFAKNTRKKYMLYAAVLSAGILIWAIILFWKADRQFHVIQYIKNQIDTSTIIEEEYNDPKNVNIVFPDKKRNLIYILVESGETSTQDRENGGLMPVNYTPEMTEIMKSGISFSQSDLFVGASVAPDCSWTMGGDGGRNSRTPS